MLYLSTILFTIYNTIYTILYHRIRYYTILYYIPSSARAVSVPIECDSSSLRKEKLELIMP